MMASKVLFSFFVIILTIVLLLAIFMLAVIVLRLARNRIGDLPIEWSFDRYYQNITAFFFTSHYSTNEQRVDQCLPDDTMCIVGCHDTTSQGMATGRQTGILTFLTSDGRTGMNEGKAIPCDKTRLCKADTCFAAGNKRNNLMNENEDAGRPKSPSDRQQMASSDKDVNGMKTTKSCPAVKSVSKQNENKECGKAVCPESDDHDEGKSIECEQKVANNAKPPKENTVSGLDYKQNEDIECRVTSCGVGSNEDCTDGKRIECEAIITKDRKGASSNTTGVQNSPTSTNPQQNMTKGKNMTSCHSNSRQNMKMECGMDSCDESGNKDCTEGRKIECKANIAKGTRSAGGTKHSGSRTVSVNSQQHENNGCGKMACAADDTNNNEGSVGVTHSEDNKHTRSRTVSLNSQQRQGTSGCGMPSCAVHGDEDCTEGKKNECKGNIANGNRSTEIGTSGDTKHAGSGPVSSNSHQQENKACGKISCDGSNNEDSTVIRPAGDTKKSGRRPVSDNRQRDMTAGDKDFDDANIKRESSAINANGGRKNSDLHCGKGGCDDGEAKDCNCDELDVDPSQGMKHDGA